MINLAMIYNKLCHDFSYIYFFFAESTETSKRALSTEISYINQTGNKTHFTIQFKIPLRQ